jgi:hypothetical protein
MMLKPTKHVMQASWPTVDSAVVSKEPSDVTTTVNSGPICKDSWKGVWNVLFAIIKPGPGEVTEAKVQEQGMWDLALGNWYERTSVADLRGYWARWPDKDPNRTFSEMLYDVLFFGFIMTKMKKV